MSEIKKDQDIDYLDEKFPKGQDKRRGEALVLLALARKEGEPYIHYDKEVDILDVWFKKKVEHSIELYNVNVIVDFDEKGNVLGFEFFNWSEDLERGLNQNKKIFEYKNYEKEMQLNYKNQYPDEEFNEDFTDKIIWDLEF
jgi:uncharacterized protein YuzE